MDPTSGKLFGVIGNAESSEETPAVGSAAADAVVLSWYTLKWLKCQGYGEDQGVAEAAPQADIVTAN